MRHDDWLTSPYGVSLAAWAAPAALSVYVKMIVLVQVGVCIDCFNLVGQSPIDKFGEVSFFRNDLFLALIAVPAVLLLVLRVAGRHADASIAAVASALTCLWLFVQLQSLQSVGMFVSASLLRDALVWGWTNPGGAASYVEPRDLAVLAGGLGWILVVWWRGTRPHQVRTGSAWLPPRAVAVACAVVAAAVSLTAWIPRVAVTPYHRSVLSWALFPSHVGTSLAAHDFSGATAANLVAAYRDLSRMPAPSRDPRYWGTMKDADVLFFVFETGPAECLPIAGDLSDFPTLRRLRERAFVAPAHYSTAPLTNRAWLSIFASWYPTAPDFDAAFAGGRTLPGVVSRTAEAGYETTVYKRIDPDLLVPGDTEPLQALGFRDVKFPSTRRVAPPATQEHEGEQVAIGLLRQDIAARARSGRRVTAAYLPVVGHAPWRDVTNGQARTVLERGRALMVLQDRWLGEIVDELERHNRLDHTVIVVTSDHGLRTRKEDPDFTLGMIDAITFHVPLLVFAPQTLTNTVTVPWVTSHVDIAPTVLDLLGLERDRDGEQGLGIWDAALADRVAFQPASLYLGADGMARDGRFLMYGYLTDRAFESQDMRFAPGDELPRSSSAALQAIGLLQRFRALQDRWAVVRPGL